MYECDPSILIPTRFNPYYAGTESDKPLPPV